MAFDTCEMILLQSSSRVRDLFSYALDPEHLTGFIDVARLERPLWECPDCGRHFANRNQSHFCGHYELGSHFEGKPAEIHLLFDAVVKAIERCGPVIVIPEKTRIAFQTRMSFAQVMPRTKWLDGHVVLARFEHPRFGRSNDLPEEPRPPLPSDLTCGYRR